MGIRKDISEGMFRTADRIQEEASAILETQTQDEKDWLIWRIRNTQNWLKEAEEKIRHLEVEEKSRSLIRNK